METVKYDDVFLFSFFCFPVGAEVVTFLYTVATVCLNLPINCIIIVNKALSLFIFVFYRPETMDGSQRSKKSLLSSSILRLKACGPQY